MIAFLPGDFAGLVLMVFLLGLRHGMDPDHLATIDGLVRFNAPSRPRVARWSGFLFSLGHGVVVTAVAGLVATTLHDRGAPGWLEPLGNTISIAFLFALGALNISAVLRTPADRVVSLAGIKGRWLGRFAATGHPAVIAFIGAAFALSFDTISQAAVFSLTGMHRIGWLFSVALGIVFTLGMMTTDGFNGAWVAHMVRRADRRARIASRAMGLSIALLGIAIGAIGLARVAFPGAAAALDGAQLQIGIALVAAVVASFGAAMLLTRSRAA